MMMLSRSRVLPFCALGLVACTTLGPTPAATGVSAVPAGRAGAEVQLGAVPGYHLSQAVAEDPVGASIPQVSGLLEVGELIGAPGLVVGGRVLGEDGDLQYEPMLGYRAALGADRRLAVAGVVHGTHAAAAARGASYTATRFGAELAGDLRLGAAHRWAELHLFGSLSLTSQTVDGRYCVDASRRYGADCGEPPHDLTAAHVNGAYPAASAGVALDLFRHRPALFHGARLSAQLGGGAMPKVVVGEPPGATSFVAIGVAVTVGLGAAR